MRGESAANRPPLGGYYGAGGTPFRKAGAQRPEGSTRTNAPGQTDCPEMLRSHLKSASKGRAC